MAKQFCIVNLVGGIVQNRKPVTVLFQSLKDGKYQLEISPVDKRSNQANRYYWGVVITMIQQEINRHGSDYTKEEIHEMLKAKFNHSDFIDTNTGEVVPIPLSTTRLSKAKFFDYVTKIQAWASELLQIVIPDPGEQMMLEYD